MMGINHVTKFSNFDLIWTVMTTISIKTLSSMHWLRCNHRPSMKFIQTLEVIMFTRLSDFNLKWSLMAFDLYKNTNRFLALIKVHPSMQFIKVFFGVIVFTVQDIKTLTTYNFCPPQKRIRSYSQPLIHMPCMKWHVHLSYSVYKVLGLYLWWPQMAVDLYKLY